MKEEMWSHMMDLGLDPITMCDRVVETLIHAARNSLKRILKCFM